MAIVSKDCETFSDSRMSVCKLAVQRLFIETISLFGIYTILRHSRTHSHARTLVQESCCQVPTRDPCTQIECDYSEIAELLAAFRQMVSVEPENGDHRSCRLFHHRSSMTYTFVLPSVHNSRNPSYTYIGRSASFAFLHAPPHPTQGQPRITKLSSDGQKYRSQSTWPETGDR